MAKNISPAHVAATEARIDWLRANFPEIEKDPESWIATIQSETQAYEDIDGLLQLALSDTHDVAVIAARAKRLRERIDHSKTWIMKLMRKVGITKHPTPLATLSISERVHVNITDRDIIPRDYWHLVLDEDKIEKDLRDGIDVKGAVLAVSAPSLSIRQS